MASDSTRHQGRCERRATPDTEAAGEVVRVKRLTPCVVSPGAGGWFEAALESRHRAHDRAAGLVAAHPGAGVAEQRHRLVRIERTHRQHRQAVLSDMVTAT